MRILFLTRSLNTGGAERQLITTAKGLSKRGHIVSVMVFYEGGDLESDLEKTGISILGLDKNGRWDLFPFFFHIIKQVRNLSPDVLYSFMTGANIFSVLIKKFIGNTKIVCGIRASDMDLSQYDWVVKLTNRLECNLSRFTDGIIVNSNAGRNHAIKMGVPTEKIHIVFNGIDTDKFKFNQEARNRLRSLWGVNEDEVFIGIIARLDPIKDHKTFLEAAELLRKKTNKVKFVCIGGGAKNYRSILMEYCTDLKLDDVLIWAGERHDITDVISSLDIASSSSISEGFPNVVAEAMACGRNCVVTDAGDSATIVGDKGRVVPISDPEALAAAWWDVIECKDLPSPEDIRSRIVTAFGMEQCTINTLNILSEL